MPNLVEVSERLKGMPDQFLQQEAQNPSGIAPPFLVLSEMSRRASLRKQPATPPTTTVYDDLVAQGTPPMPAGMQSIDALNPQMMSRPAAGLRAYSPQGPPRPPAAQPTRMKKGGVVKRMYGGGIYGDDDNEMAVPYN